jgi:lincosamide nucleotidyltransferase A/C/D/E
MLSAHDAVALCGLLEQRHIRYFVMGGWGVDALLGRQTRPHKDLDLLVVRADVPALWTLFREHGFIRQWVWRENRWLDEEEGGEQWPSAFVAADGAGRELDVHVIDLAPDGGIIQHYDDPWPFPASIAAQGSIAGTVVPCVSLETQLAMHTGYPLPEGHRRDIELLQAD